MVLTSIDTPTVPVERPARPEWGSDVVAEMLRRLGVEYAALNPGASFRGLHDSLVNYNGNRDPQMVICNHEEVAVAVAHGYAKAAGKPMAAIAHSNVGLLHATMGIFNAWVDRAPVFVLGATGPMDSTRRRPWIDWIHTSHGQGEVVRDFTKWEHQPASVAAIPEAMLRAWRAMLTRPCGPIYFCLDAGLQEERLDPSAPTELLDPARYPLPLPPAPPPAAVEEAARLLVQAEFPVLLVGSGGRSEASWRQLVELAELLGAAVVSGMKSPASFPTNHPLHLASPKQQPDANARAVLDQADLVLALEWVDPVGMLRGGPPTAGRGDGAAQRELPRLVLVSLEDFAVRSWVADHQELPPAELTILSTVEQTVAALLPEVQRRTDSAARERAARRARAHHARRAQLEAAWAAARDAAYGDSIIRLERLVGDLVAALGPRALEATLARAPIKWPNGLWDFSRPGAYIGNDGGAGIGSGPGMSVGAALALRGSGGPTVAVLGDGDTLMASSAFWTAAHHRLPLLTVVANNRTYFNDEEHQERVARVRSRPVENRWVGQRMDEPPVDFAGLARSMGVEGFGPVAEPAELVGVYREALRAVEEGRPALVDVVVRY